MKFCGLIQRLLDRMPMVTKNEEKPHLAHKNGTILLKKTFPGKAKV